MTSGQFSTKRIVEAALLASDEPLTLDALRRLFEPDPGADILASVLAELQQEWSGKAVELVCTAGGWRFRTRAEIQPWLDRLRTQRAPAYSRAVWETLAVIAYRQPVTRGDIEAIRGVTVSTQVLRTLEGRGWIEIVVHRDGPGRPALYATTQRFLDDLGLRHVRELPPLAELEAMLEPLQEAHDKDEDENQGS